MRRLFTVIALATLASGPAALSAQQASFAPASPSAPTTQARTSPPLASSPVPMVHNDVAGIQVKHDTKAPLVVNSAAATGLHQGEGVALMAVGGAGLLAGLLIGGKAGTAVAIGGLAVGLAGLYEYVL